MSGQLFFVVIMVGHWTFSKQKCPMSGQFWFWWDIMSGQLFFFVVKLFRILSEHVSLNV